MEDQKQNTPVARTAEAIAKDTRAYGFVWDMRPLHAQPDRKGPKVLIRKEVPHFSVPDDLADVFIRTWPDVARQAINGTSTVVKGQNCARDILASDRTITTSALAVELINRVLLGATVRRVGATRTVYVGADGKQYDSVEAAANAPLSAPFESPIERAAALMATLAEHGITGETARNIARAQVPEAFPSE